MAYKHGIYVSEVPSSVRAAVKSDAGIQAIIGTAPVNLLKDPYHAANIPMALAQIELGEAQNIGLTGYGKLSGKYFIDKVSLTYSRNGLEQTLECSKIPDEKTTTTGAGASVTLNNAPLYYTSVDKKPVRRISGHYFLYDGINVAGRYRITNLQSRCGKTPVGKNVTGWVDAADVGGAT